MANTVDEAIQGAVAKYPLPKRTGILLTEEQIKHRVRGLLPRTKYYESGVAESYAHHAAECCLPIASTLAVHPSSESWSTILNWTVDGKIGSWAIPDGVLRVSPDVFRDAQWERELLQNEDDGKKGIMKQLAVRTTALAVWEIKSLTVGTAQVMKEIVEMGLTHAKFPRKKCTLTPCKHRFWEGMEESNEIYDAGFDAHSPPWTLSSVPPTSSVDSRPTPLRQGLRSASAQGSTTSSLSYTEYSQSSVEDCEGVGEKRRRNESDASEYERPPPKKGKRIRKYKYVQK
jgi:hypothetical protein